MTTVTYYATAHASWSNGDFGTSDFSSDSVVIQPRFQGCGDDTKNKIKQEYAIYPISSSPSFSPDCTWLRSDRSSSNYSWSTFNSGDYGIGLMKQPMRNIFANFGLDAWIYELGYAPALNSGYRNPRHNQNVGGAGHSRHMYGDAADLQNASNTQAEYDNMAAAASAAYADYIEPSTGPCGLGCTHADWRSTNNGDY